MSSFLPSVPYQAAGEGYWGPVTATIDWCEENYYMTHYCAEVINTFTNAMFAYLGYRGIKNCLHNGHDRVFLMAFAAYLVIGLSSFCFHATLALPMQLLDETSMIYTSSVLGYALFSHTKSTPVKIVIGVLDASLALFITLYYFHIGDPAFHQASFFLLTLGVVLRGIYLMEITLRPRWRKVVNAVQGRPERWTNGHGAVVRAKKEFEESEARDRADEDLLGRMYALIGSGLAMALTGFAIWGFDQNFCGYLMKWRHAVGMPLGFLLEGHGWWHILTGLAAYYNIVWNIWMRYALYGRRDEIEMRWPSIFSLPQVLKKDKMKTR